MSSPRTTANQGELPLREKFTHGGKREGAGRPKKKDAGVAHVRRPALSHHHPVHLTFRMRPDVWNLRAKRTFRAIAAAMRGVLPRSGFRVVHFSVQGNHVHAIAEAADRIALSRGAKALGIRIAKGLNEVMHRRGPVLSDRYHVHVLRMPAEVRRAIQYVVGNAESHARRAGRPVLAGWVDPFSSAAPESGGLVSEATTWLLTAGRTRARDGSRATNPSG